MLECGRNEHQTRFFVQTEDDVHILDCLTRGALDHVVDRGAGNELADALVVVERNIAEIRVSHVMDVGALAVVEQSDKELVLVEVLIRRADLLEGNAGLDVGIDRREDARPYR